jgi:signal transduction histidine kinase
MQSDLSPRYQIAHDLPHIRAWQWLRSTWPFWLLIACNGLALGWMLTRGPLRLSGLSVLAASIIFISGLLPILRRPGLVSTILGCFAAALAVLVGLMPKDVLGWFVNVSVLLRPHANPQWYEHTIEALQLTNAALLGPLALHLAVARAPHPPLPRRVLAGMYMLLVVSLVAVLTNYSFISRMLGQVALMTVMNGTLVITIWLLVRACKPMPEPSRLAPEARLVLSSLLLAELPLLVAPLLWMVGLELPDQLALGSQVILPIGVAAAILRHDPFKIDVTVRRAMGYGMLSLLLLALYLGLTSALTFVLSLTAQPLRGVAMLGGLLLAALAFMPVRLLTERFIERALYPERALFQQELMVVQAALSRVVRRDAIAILLTETLPSRLGVAWARLDLDSDPSHTPAPPQPAAWEISLRVNGKTFGRYRLGPRRTGLPYTIAEQNQLATLLDQAALALAYAETVDALKALNVELEERVEARSAQVMAQQRELITIEERQRLARDLHDSVKQTLFSLGLGLRAARGLIAVDTNAAKQALRDQEQVVVQTQAEMGALLAQLRAPARGPIDLAQTLSEHCDSLERQHGLRVDLDAPPSLVLPERTASELLHVTREALHNIVKHSTSSSARLRLALAEQTLIVEVADYGCGFDQAASHAGMGLRGMHERVSDLGGRLAISSAPAQGTLVQAWVPISN